VGTNLLHTISNKLDFFSFYQLSAIVRKLHMRRVYNLQCFLLCSHIAAAYHSHTVFLYYVIVFVFSTFISFSDINFIFLNILQIQNRPRKLVEVSFIMPVFTKECESTSNNLKTTLLSETYF
jgi:hypothetical protein